MTSSGEEILASIGSPRAPILMRLSEYEGRRALDIRRYFKPAGQDELSPTKKGISLNREALRVLLNVLATERDSIEAWLDESAFHERDTMAVRRAAVSDLATGPRPYDATSSGWKDPTFFKVNYNGTEDALVLNGAHPFCQSMELMKDQGGEAALALLRMVEAILVAYARSKSLFRGVDQISAETLFDDLEFNWGLILARQAKQDDSL
jgi:hypothetical protein